MVSSDIEVTLNDKRTFKAKVIGTDPNTDIALIKIDAKDLPVIVFWKFRFIESGRMGISCREPF
jgi:serine protease Do